MSRLKPSVQCVNAAAKAMQILRVIKRNFVSADEEDSRLLFNGFVRPVTTPGILCVCLVSLFGEVKDTECLEKVQRRATKLIQCLKYKQYDERLNLFSITSLQKRRIRGVLIHVFRRGAIA